MNAETAADSTAEPIVGIIVVDHGSRREASNALLPVLVEQLRAEFGWSIVEPAHMELAEPSIAVAFQRCVEQGAQRIIVHPYFLGPGRHWSEDIPNLSLEASGQNGGVPFTVTHPLGPHPLLLEVIRDRVDSC